MQCVCAEGHQAEVGQRVGARLDGCNYVLLYAQYASGEKHQDKRWAGVAGGGGWGRQNKKKKKVAIT